MATNIYLIENIYFEPSKKYVGKTIKTIEARFSEHISSGKNINGSSKISESLRDYGKINHKTTLLEVVDDKFAFQREQYWIDKFNTLYEGYNIKNEFVEKAPPHYFHQKEKAIENLKNGVSWNKGIAISNETRKKMIETKKKKYELGFYDNSYGHPHTTETKQKISEIKKNYYKTNRPHNVKLWIIEYENGEILKTDKLLDHLGGKKEYNKICKWCRENPNKFHPEEKMRVYYAN